MGEEFLVLPLLKGKLQRDVWSFAQGSILVQKPLQHVVKEGIRAVKGGGQKVLETW